MVMAPAPSRRRRTFSLRCLLGRHTSAEIRFQLDACPWSSTFQYCVRCMRLFEAKAVRGWR